MNIEYHRWWSPNLNQHMELKVYGHWGKPVMVFPSSGGSFHEYEDRGMIHACHHHINQGRFKFFAVDSVDRQSLLNSSILAGDRIRRHEDYERYIINEVVPFIYHHCNGGQPIYTTGCSMGAYHAVNFFLRHPDVFNGTIALSGVYDLNAWFPNYDMKYVYYHSPISYLPGLNDGWFIERYKRSQIHICVGKGKWEGNAIPNTGKMADIFHWKGIPANVEFWGYDVYHDWPWWQRQMPYFLDKIW